MNWSKLEEIRERAWIYSKVEAGTVIWEDSMHPEVQMAKDILWLCRQIDRNVPKKIAKRLTHLEDDIWWPSAKNVVKVKDNKWAAAKRKQMNNDLFTPDGKRGSKDR